MAFSAPAPRRHMHTRDVHCEGFLREDGLWDIEASIIDRKTFAYTEPVRGRREPGSEVHHMAIRLTMSADMEIRAVEVEMPATPYPSCANAAPNYQALVGKKIGGGWRAAVQEAVGKARGCTHARELLFPMATVAIQTIHGWRESGSDAAGNQPLRAGGKPYFIDDCYGWAADGPVVARFYPAHATKPAGDKETA